MIQAILVDDEEKNLLTLKGLLEKHCPSIELLAMAGSVSSAIDMIRTHQPELVFLDVVMPEENGFELLKSFETLPFKVIFTTAFERYAVKAIKFSALDYLMKPIDYRELKEAVNKFDSKPESQHLNAKMNLLKENLQQADGSFSRIALPTDNSYTFIKLKEIIRCEASGNYTCFYLLGGEKILIRKTLKEYEELLGEEHFVRTHNSHLINMQHVREYVRGKGGYVIMVDSMEVEVSVRRKPTFLKAMPKG